LVLVISVDDIKGIKNLVNQIKDTQHDFGEVSVDLYDAVSFEFQDKDHVTISLENMVDVGHYTISDAKLIIDTDIDAYLWIKFVDLEESSSYFTARVDVASFDNDE